MENAVENLMSGIGNVDPLSNEIAFAQALNSSATSLEFTGFVHVLVEEIKKFYKIDKHVNAINDPEEYKRFLLELGSFLRELDCPYIRRITNNMSSVLNRNDGQLLLLDYLMFELLTARKICAISSNSAEENDPESTLIVKVPSVKYLQDILSEVDIKCLPPNVDPNPYLTMLKTKIRSAIENDNQNKLIGNQLYSKVKATTEWNNLENTFVQIANEYKIKRDEVIAKLKTAMDNSTKEADPAVKLMTSSDPEPKETMDQEYVKLECNLRIIQLLLENDDKDGRKPSPSSSSGGSSTSLHDLGGPSTSRQE